MVNSLLLAYLTLVGIGTVSGLKCFSCNDISHPQLCKQIVTCGDGEVCGMQKFLTPGGETRYSINCVARTWCSTFGSPIHKRGDLVKRNNLVKRDNFMICYDCCSEDLCNSGGCGERSIKDLNKTVCLNCADLADQRHCRTVDICNDNEICYIQERPGFLGTYFDTGCKRKTLCNILESNNQLVGRRKRTDLCVKCCHGNLCNDICYGHTHTQHVQTTLSSSGCTDGPNNCDFLHKQYEICNNDEAIETFKCHRTCGKCGFTANRATVAVTTTSTTATTVTTTTSPSVTIGTVTSDSHSNGEVCRNGWSYIDGTCKLFITRPQSWLEAQVDCQKRGGTLMSIDDHIEQQILDKYMTHYYDNTTVFWIGLNMLSDDNWHWAENYQIVRFNKWIPNMNFINTERCVAYSGAWGFYWMPKNCNDRYGAICKYRR